MRRWAFVLRFARKCSKPRSKGLLRAGSARRNTRKDSVWSVEFAGVIYIYHMLKIGHTFTWAALLSGGLASLLLALAFAGDTEKKESEKPGSFCDIFDLATFYKGEKGDFLESLATVGRLQADAACFHEAPDRKFNALLWRRFFDGFEAKFRDGFTLHGEVEFNLNERDPLYERITEAYLAWRMSEAQEIRAGKITAGFTLDGKTSSRLLLRPERNLLSWNLWFPDNFFSGMAADGKINGWEYNLGCFSSAGGREFGDFDAGYFGLLSIGRDVGEQVGLKKAYVAMDYVHKGRDRNNRGTRNSSNVVSLNIFAGVNYSICDHKLKLQSGVEYTTARDAAHDGGQYNGWGYTTAFRMYW